MVTSKSSITSTLCIMVNKREIDVKVPYVAELMYILFNILTVTYLNTLNEKVQQFINDSYLNMAKLCSQISIHLTENVLEMLNKRKIFTVLDFLHEDPEKLVYISKLPYKEILQIRHTIIANTSAFPQKGINVYKDLVANSALIATGIQSLDSMLQGGLLTGSLYELCGFSGAGKTQLCLTVATNISQHLKQQVHYVDAKLDFSGKRIQAMLESRGCDEELIGEVMEKIKVTRIQDVFQLFSFLHSLKERLQHEQDKRSGVRLVIIDSLPTIFFPFLGEAQSGGFGLMNHLASTMKYIAQEFHIAFLLVNFATRWHGDVTPGDDDENEDGGSDVSETIKPTLGKYWLHVPSTRLFLEKKSKSDEVVISVIKSTRIKVGTLCSVVISDRGVE